MFAEFFHDLSFLLLTLTLIDDVSQSKCWAAVLMFQSASASSLDNCSAIGDEGSGALPRAFIQTLRIPDLNIIYWHPCDNRLHFSLVEIYRFTLEPTICENITSTSYEYFICVKWVGFLM